MAQMVSFDNAPIRITARGEWVQNDEPLHPRVVKLFSKALVATLDGRYFIQLGFQRYELEVEDTAYFVHSIELERDPAGRLSRVVLGISDGRTEVLRGDSLMQGVDNEFYCRIIRGELGVPCRFPPRHYHTLGLEMEMDDGGPYLELAGAR
ncbi:MAG: hypothetical protein AAFQ82_19690, partial [Myxococcota bacterium]